MPLIHDPSKCKLGRKPTPFDRRTLRLSRYLTPAIPDPPSDYKPASMPNDWRMMANDTIGDCAFADPGHAIMEWTDNSGQGLYVPPDKDIIQAYSDVAGYDPTDPLTDVGADPVQVAKYWQKTGISGHKLGAFALLNVQNQRQVMLAISLFGNAGIAWNLPTAAQNLDVWDIPAGQPLTGDWAPGSWGGHMTCAISYLGTWGPGIVTWGALKQVTWAFLAAYGDPQGSLARFSTDLLNDDGKSPEGFDQPTLLADLAQVQDMAA